MSVVDTLVGTVVGGILVLATNGVTYLLEERKFKRDVTFRSYGERQAALNGVFESLTNCYLTLTAAVHSPPKTTKDYLEEIDTAIRQCNKDVLLKALWLSTTWPQITSCLETFQRIGIAIQIRLQDTPEQSRPPLSDFPLDPRLLDSAYYGAGNIIGQALGIPDLENAVRGILKVPEIRAPPAIQSS